MPNHFHLMVYVKKLEAGLKSGSTTLTKGFTSSEALGKSKTLNDSIGIMLRTYTRAINKQEDRSGSLFRQETMAVCLTNSDKTIDIGYKIVGVTIIENTNPEKQYPNVCFNYILSNPVKDGLVKNIDDWEFSSYCELRGIRNDGLIYRERIKEFGLTYGV